MSLNTMLANVFSRYRDACAITDRDGARTLTYGELGSLAGRCAGKLRASGINPGDRVIVKMGRKLEYVAAELAILRLGAVAIPLIPSYPDERVRYIMKDAEVGLIIGESFFEDVEGYEEVPFMTEAEEGPDADERIDFIFYTSGSTGNPKGVIFRDKAVVNAITRNLEDGEKTKPLIYGAPSTFSFVASITEYYVNFCLGGHLHLLSDAVRSDANKMADYFAEHHITASFMSPRVLKVFKNKDKDLKWVMEGGEKSREVYSSEFQIINAYAQTETICSVLSFHVDRSYPETPLGKPRKGIRISILDEEGREVPDGEEGAMVVTGVLPHEYLNLPEMTRKTFTVHEDGLVSVRTGDRAKRLPDGNILYVNREDWMLKINGQRVEPGEIESAMCEAEGVTGAIAKEFEQEDGTSLLVGFYTQEGDIALEKANLAIKAALEARLPHYMIPTVFVRMDRFPVNANGKIDRKAIQKPDLSSQLVDYEKPENEMEEAITRAMEKVLKLPRIGRKDNFFSLGGNSLNAVTLAYESGLASLTPQFVMIGKTAEGIAELLTAGAVSRPAIEKSASLKERYPLSLAQRYQYDACAFLGKPIDVIDNRYYFLLNPDVDEERLKEAVRETVKEHPVYQIGIEIEKNEMFLRKEDFDLPTLLLEGEDFDAFRKKKNQRVRDLSKDPLFEAAIIHTGEKRFFYVDFCHLIYDGASLDLFMKTVEGKYSDKENQENPDHKMISGNLETPQEVFSIFDLVESEQKTKDTAFYKKAEQYFDSLYGSLTPSAFFGEEITDTAVSKPLLEGIPEAELQKRLPELGISILTFFMGAMEITVKKWKGKEDFCYRCVYSGRTEEGLQNTHGVLAKAVYLKSQEGRSGSVKDYLMNIQDQYQNLVLYDVCDIPSLLEKYSSMRSGISFNYMGAEKVRSSIFLAGKENNADYGYYDEMQKAHKTFTRFDFIIGRYPSYDGYQAVIASARVTGEEAQAFLEMYDAVLRKLLQEEEMEAVFR